MNVATVADHVSVRMGAAKQCAKYVVDLHSVSMALKSIVASPAVAQEYVSMVR